MQSLLNDIKYFFTPSHKKPVDEHIVQDRTTRLLIEDTEKLLIRMAEHAPPQNQKRVIRRKQKEWTIKVKVTHTFISVQMQDLKTSSSPIKKQIMIICHRKYMKSSNGVGVCKEATIRYMKDGRAHIRSIRETVVFNRLFYQIHHLDLAFSNETHHDEKPSKELIEAQHHTLKSIAGQDIALLIDEGQRYIRSMFTFSIDPTIENRLNRIIQTAKKLQVDFNLLEFEERHTVRRMLREDIPSLLHTYFSLSLKHQLEQTENVYIALTKMELTLMEYVERLEKLRVERMEHLLKLQSIRYNKS